MSNNKKQQKAKEPIKMRLKTLANGNQSIYLALFNNGKWEYEFLKLYLVPERTPADKESNAQTLRLANAVKSQRIVELQNNAHGFTGGGKRSKVNAIEYIKTLADKKRIRAGGTERGVFQGYNALAYQLKQYSGDKITFKQSDKTYCEGFIE